MITMYGKSHCSDCTRAKQYFASNDVEYRYVDVEENPEEIDTVIRYNQGRRSVPVIVFPDGSHLTEPSDDQLAAKLA